jgi:glycosyltransferase 2 family protein
MKSAEQKKIRRIKPSRIILPMVLGLLVVAYFIKRDINTMDFSIIEFSWYAVVFILISFVLMFLRDFGYSIRLRVLSSGDLSWRKCIRIILLWEFGSAVAPTAIGGTGLATYFIWKEGLSIGRSTSIVMATSFLDELYFSLVFPLIFVLFSNADLFEIDGAETYLNQFFYFALIGYVLKLAWTFFMGYSLFINPRLIGKIVNFIFKLRWLKKRRRKAVKFAQDFKHASVDLKGKPFRFWIKAVLATAFSWTSRYWVLNFLIMALIASLTIDHHDFFIPIAEHFLIFARQLIMWIMMLVMPTPGGSGFVETVFLSYMADFIPVVGFVAIMALVWRLVTYYPYLIIGAIISPKWVNKHIV